MRIEYIELRKDPRINTAVEVTYCTDAPAPNGGTAPPLHTGTLTDWGDGGAGLVLEQPFRLNETLRLLQGADGSNQPRNCTVRWVQKDRERYRVGVKFNETGE